MPSAQNKIQIVDTHETSETLAITRLQRVGYQINRTLLMAAIRDHQEPLSRAPASHSVRPMMAMASIWSLAKSASL
jgi:homoaconitase/3-isopropylmalate dehydratase large subunit